MNRVSILLLSCTSVVCSTQCIEDRYQVIDVYGIALYTLLNDYTTTDTSRGFDQVKSFLQEDVVSELFENAAYKGYSRHAVIKSAYNISLQQNPINALVVSVLQATVKQYNFLK